MYMLFYELQTSTKKHEQYVRFCWLESQLKKALNMCAWDWKEKVKAGNFELIYMF